MTTCSGQDCTDDYIIVSGGGATAGASTNYDRLVAIVILRAMFEYVRFILDRFSTLFKGSVVAPLPLALQSQPPPSTPTNSHSRSIP